MPTSLFHLPHRATRFSRGLFAAAFVGTVCAALPAQSKPTGTAARVSSAYQNLPMQFEPNQGQANASARYVAHGQGYSISLQTDAATFALQAPAKKLPHGVVSTAKTASGEVVRMELLGADSKAAMAPEKPLTSYVNYLVGTDRSKWHTGIPTFGQTRVAGVYPGVDLVYYGTQRQLEYDFVVAPGAKTDAIHFALRGATPVLAANGDLTLQAATTSNGHDISFRKPVLYQELNGIKQPVDGAFTVAANGEVGFRVGAYDHGRTLVIDPILSYAGYYGGPGEDEINGSAINVNNQLYVVGQTYSVTLPNTAGTVGPTNPTYTNNAGGHTAFVAKFSADGSSILWSTFLGGTGDDFAEAVAVATGDQPVLVGYTNSCGGGPGPGQAYFAPVLFPIAGLCNPVGGSVNGVPAEVNGGGYDAYMLRLSSDGKTIVAGTFLGGSNNDLAQGVAIGPTGNVYVVGETTSTGYAVSNQGANQDVPAYPIDSHGNPDVGTANYPTTPTAFYTNTTESMLYATANPGYSVAYGGPTDEQAFLTVLSPAGGILYSTLIGGGIIGGCGNGACNTNGLAIAVNANGIAFIGGNTSSAHWPVSAGALVPTCSNAGAANSECPLTGWLAAFDPTKSGAASLVFSTYLNGTTGGTSPNATSLYPASDVFGLATDSTGNVIATGDTSAVDFPTTAGTLQPACIKFNDGNGDTGVCNFGPYVTKLSQTGSMLWSTYVGTTTSNGGGGTGNGLALDANNNVYLLASAQSGTFPTKNAFSAFGGGGDAYLAELSPTGSTLLMGTYLGAGGGVSINNNALHLDSNLNAYFSGYQGVNPYGGTYLPVTANAADKAIQGNDGFVVKIITQQQPSATALAVAPSGSVTPTTSVTLTATVTTPSTLTGSLLPTGTVTFLNGATTVGTGKLNASGVAIYSGILATGTYTITAQYAGDAGFNGSTSSPSALTVSPATATATALTVSPASSVYGAGSTLTATVTSGTAPATAGTVTFAAGAVSLGTATVNAQGVATLLAKPAVGSYAVVASYAGTYNATSNPSGYGASTSAGIPLTVTKAASTTALAVSATSLGTGGSLTLTATVTSGATGTVIFYNNGTTALGSGTIGTNGTATLTLALNTIGSYAVTASYAGDTNYSGSVSGVTTVMVVAPGFSINASPTSLTIARGTIGTTTLTVTATGGYTGSFTLGCGALPALATCTFTPSTVALSGTTVTSTLLIGTGTTTYSTLSAPQRPGSNRNGFTVTMALLLPGALMGLLGFSRRRRLAANLQRFALVLALCAITVAAMSGCGGGGGATPASTPNYTNTTAAGTYTVPVTITPAGGSAQSISLNVTVQ